MSQKNESPRYLMVLWVSPQGVEKVTFPGPDHPNEEGFACYTATFPLVQRLSRAVRRWVASRRPATATQPTTSSREER